MVDDPCQIEIISPAQRELEDIAALYQTLGGTEIARKITNKTYDAF